MHATMTHLLDEFNDVVSADPDLAAAEKERQIHLAKERIQSRTALEPTEGNTQVKEAEKASFIEDLMKPVGRAQAWAARTNNGDVAAQLKISATDLHTTPDIQLTGKVENIMTVLRSVVGQIESVTAPQLDALDDRLDKLQSRLGSPRVKIGEREAAGRQAVLEFAAATKVLTQQHDKIVRSYNIANPASPAEQRQRELWDRWKSAREIVDAPTLAEASEVATPAAPAKA